jgi:hypothetical protein
MIAYFSEATGNRRIFLLSALAVASALLTHFVQTDPWRILNISRLYGSGALAPVLPGLYFGSVLAIGAYAWKKTDLFGAGIILLGTTLAWVAAYEFAFHFVTYEDSSLRALCKNITTPLLDELKNYRDLVQNPVSLPSCTSKKLGISVNLLAGIIAGFIGGLITLLAMAFVVPGFRTINNWTRTLLVASLAGALLANNISALPLFIVWQVAVAASIAYGWSFRETLHPASP